MIYSFKTTLEFGRYKGLSLVDIASAPGVMEYLVWALENVSEFETEPEIEKYFRTAIKLKAKEKKLLKTS